MSQKFASVWDAIEETPALAENMELRSSLMLAPKEHIVQEGMTKAEAAKKFGVTQPEFPTSSAARSTSSRSTPSSTCSPPPEFQSNCASVMRPEHSNPPCWK